MEIEGGSGKKGELLNTLVYGKHFCATGAGTLIERSAVLTDRSTMPSASDKFAELPDDESLRVERLLRAVEIFREFDTAFPASYMAAFMYVALQPGKGPSEIGESMGVAQAAASRLILEIGQKSRHGGEGLGLVDSAPDPADMRVKRLFLTTKGRQLLRRLLLAL
jgi:DNA-binding MarR family transcriptional regulator